MPKPSLSLWISMLLVLLSVPAAASTADGVTGVWLDEDGSGYIRITREGDVWEGRIAGSVEGAVEKDVNNPDPARRDESLLGRKILIGLSRDGDVWEGEIYNPRDGRTYSARITVPGPGQLRVHGYLGLPLLGQSQTWTRVTDSEAPGLKIE